MSNAGVLNTIFSYEFPAAQTEVREKIKTFAPPQWNVKRFEQDQVRSLVQQVFFPVGVRSPRQVVFTAVDADGNVPGICLQVGRSLCRQTSGKICIVETNCATAYLEPSMEESRSSPQDDRALTSLRDAALPLSEKLWFLSADIFHGDEKNFPANRLRRRIDELRLDFDYTIFQAAPAGQSSDAHVLGHLCDGVVLILTAGSTRRVAAKNVKDKLHFANARLLGTVLSNRSFPIPENIYRRL